MGREERIQTLHLERPFAVAEDVTDQLGVHPTDERLVLFEKVVVAARRQFEPEFALVQRRTQPGIVEVLVQSVDLAQCRCLEV